ncbi:OadG family protein [Candidatus Avelusimicrobium stercoris]|mgnify:FL=1|uniref:OadG family protein n=1 Tax=Candidatus Avelusimicrobium stercoris TaxID=1947924 RepID=UPI003D0EA161
MSADSLLMQSVNITVIGMLIVFVFLTLLVGIVKMLGWLVQKMEKYFPQTAATAADNVLIAVAIAAAKRFQTK